MRTQTAKRPRSRAARDIAPAKRAALRVHLPSDEADAALTLRLKAAMNKARDLAIDAGAVAAMTTGAVQVLLAAAASAEARQLKFRLTATSPSLIDAFGELGLADEIAAWLGHAESGRTTHVAEA